MEPTISVCRKGDDIYLTLEGILNMTSSQQLFQALRRVVMTSLKCAAPESQVAFTFKTHSKVDPSRTRPQ
ncbi:MAG: hypothetical protein WC405_20410 [Syntrophales bacterium]